jgi:NitT/TauT family transport system substrate-binding protein
MSTFESRRKALTTMAALTVVPLAGAASRNIYAQTAKPIRIGYLHVPSVDAQMWLMKELGSYAKEGLDPTFARFNTGIEGFSALVGGSIDALTTGGVTHNFPARGQGIVVLPHCVEFAGQLLGRGDLGVNSLADLKGKKVATTLGTTGQLFLHTALKSIGLDSSRDVEIVSQTMPSAVTSYVTGNVPALSTWVPFNLRTRDVKTSKLLVDSRQFAPKAGFVLDAYSVTRRTLDTNADLVKRLLAAWAPANEMLIQRKDEAISVLQRNYYKDDMDLRDMRASFDSMDLNDSRKWATMMQDGSLNQMLDSVTNIFVEIGAIQNPLPASKYADFSLFTSTFKA